MLLFISQTKKLVRLQKTVKIIKLLICFRNGVSVSREIRQPSPHHPKKITSGKSHDRQGVYLIWKLCKYICDGLNMIYELLTLSIHILYFYLEKYEACQIAKTVEIIKLLIQCNLILAGYNKTDFTSF